MRQTNLSIFATVALIALGTVANAQEIKWLKNFRDAESQAKKSRKLIMVDFTGDH